MQVQYSTRAHLLRWTLTLFALAGSACEGHVSYDDVEEVDGGWDETVQGLNIVTPPLVPTIPLSPVLLATKESLFPEIVDGQSYSYEGCVATDTETDRNALVRLSTSALEPLSDLVDTGSSRYARVNSLYVGYTLQLQNSGIASDDPNAVTLVRALTRPEGPDHVADIIAADKLVFSGQLDLAPNRLYVFVASEEISFAAGAVIQSLTPTASQGADGLRGANVVLIAPKVTGQGSATFNLGGAQGGEGKAVAGVGTPSEPANCWKNYNRTSNVTTLRCPAKQPLGGKAGNGGAGGKLRVITDSRSASITFNGPGGAGGLGGKTTWYERTWYSVIESVRLCKLPCEPGAGGGGGGAGGGSGGAPLRALTNEQALTFESPSPVAPSRTVALAADRCAPVCTDETRLVSSEAAPRDVGYRTTRVAGGASGASVSAFESKALSGAAQDAMFWLAERAIKRDLLRADRMARRVTSTDSVGPTNRERAIVLFDTIQKRSCGSKAAFPGLTVTYRDRRIAQCAEIAATKLALEAGLNHFGVPEDMVVYLDPSRLEQMRDGILLNIERNFPASSTALPEKITTATTALARNEAELLAAERAEELIAADQQRSTDLKAYESALERVKRNTDAYTARAKMVQELQRDLSDALRPDPFAAALSLAVSIGSAVSTGIGAISTIKEATALIDTLHTALQSGSRIRDITKITQVVEVAGKPQERKVVDALKKVSGTLSKDASSALGDIKKGAKSGKELFGASSFVPGEPSTVGAGVCNVMPSSNRELRTLALSVRDNANAGGIIDEMLDLLDDMEELAAAACDLAEDQEIARLQSIVAQTQYDIAQLRVENAWRRLAFVDELDRGLRAERAKQAARRDTMCSTMHYWSDQAQLTDFLAARARWFVALDNYAGYPAAAGNFQANLLNPQAREAIAQRNYVTLWERGFRATSDGVTVTNIDACTAASPGACAQVGTGVAPDQLRDSIVTQLIGSGSATFNLTATDHASMLTVTPLAQRVTAAELTLWDANGRQLYAESVRNALRVSHGPNAIFVRGAATQGYLFPPTASSGLCRAVLGRLGSDRIQAECDILPKFTYYPGIPTPQAYQASTSVPRWEEAQWNLFGTSVLGQWTVDLRDWFRKENSAPFVGERGTIGPGCYPVLSTLGKHARQGCEPGNFDACVAEREGVSLDTALDWRRRAEGCLGEAFTIAPDCGTQGGECVINALTDRVAAFCNTCEAHLSISTSEASETLGLPTVSFREPRSGYCDLSGTCTPPPVECDEICGPRCRDIKREIARVRFTIRSRTP